MEAVQFLRKGPDSQAAIIANRSAGNFDEIALGSKGHMSQPLGRKQAKGKKARAKFASAPKRGSTVDSKRHAGAEHHARGPDPTRSVIATLALCLLVGVCYFPAINADFVWDDRGFLTAQPVQDPAGLWDIWLQPSSMKQAEGHYWPVVYTTFWLEHKFWGFDPVGFHIVNILLHIANAVLLYRALLLLPVPGAWVIAAAFAVHPMRVESVAWVIERKDLLSGLFYLAAAIAWLLFARSGRRKFYVVALATFGLALLSKSVAVTFPAALLIWHWWKSGRVSGADWGRMLPFFLLALAITVADLAHYRSLEDISFDFSLVERLLIASRAVWFYAGKIAWPAGLAGIYPLWDVRVADPVGWACVAGGLAVAASLWLLRDRIGRGPLAGALFFVVTLSPTLGFVDYGYMQFSFVADRFQYLAGIGLIALLVGTAAQFAVNFPAGANRWKIPAAAMLVAALGSTTWLQAGIYRDNETFFKHVISINPKARGAHHNLGSALRDKGRLDEALAAYRIALGQDPSPDEIHIDMGLTFERAGNLDEADRSYQEALGENPRHRTAMNNLALLRTRQGRFEEALELFDAVTRIDPGLVDAHIGRGVALLQTGRLELAVQSFETAVSINPELDLARSNLDAARKLLERQANEQRTQ